MYRERYYSTIVLHCTYASQLNTLPCTRVFSLLPDSGKGQRLTTEHILFQHSDEMQSVCSWFLPTSSLRLYYSHLSKTQGMNKYIIGVIYLGKWVKRIVYSWLHQYVSAPVSDRRSSSFYNERQNVGTIWSDSLITGAPPSQSELPSVRHVAESLPQVLLRYLVLGQMFLCFSGHKISCDLWL